jgi:hypothetical protein
VRDPEPKGGTPASGEPLLLGSLEAIERAEQAAQDALTVRQRLAVALSSQLTVQDWEDVVKHARDHGRTADLARLADQAFGRPSEQDADKPQDPGLAGLTRDQRAVLMAALEEDAELGAELHEGADPEA